MHFAQKSCSVKTLTKTAIMSSSEMELIATNKEEITLQENGDLKSICKQKIQATTEESYTKKNDMSLILARAFVPPPPPPTPVHSKILQTGNKLYAQTKNCENISNELEINLYSHNGKKDINLHALELKEALKAVKTKIEYDCDENMTEIENEIRRLIDKCIYFSDATPKEINHKIKAKCDVIFSSEQENEIKLTEAIVVTEVTQNMDGNMEEEALPIQALSIRSSTPHTPVMSRTEVQCCLSYIPEHVSPVKEINVSNASKLFKWNIDDQFENKTLKMFLKESNVIPTMIEEEKIKKLNSCKSDSGNCSDFRNYSRTNLLLIRNEMESLQKEKKLSNGAYDCSKIELQARLRRLNLLRQDEEIINLSQSNYRYDYKNNFSKFCRDSSAVYYRPKNITITDGSIIKSQPLGAEFKSALNDANKRRIGSGRILQNKFQCQMKGDFDRNQTSHLSEKFVDLAEVIQFPDNALKNKCTQPIQPTDGNTFVNKFKGTNNMHYMNNTWNEKCMCSAIPNFRGRVLEARQQMKYEEPEWMISGPTSRFDTIELSGFDEHSEDFLHENNIADRIPIDQNFNDLYKAQHGHDHSDKTQIRKRFHSRESNSAKYVHIFPKCINSLQDKASPSTTFQYDNPDDSIKQTEIQQNSHKQNQYASYYHEQNSKSRFLPLFDNGNSTTIFNTQSVPETEINQYSKKYETTIMNEFFKQALKNNCGTKQVHNSKNIKKTSEFQSNANVLSDIPSVGQLEAKLCRPINNVAGNIILPLPSKQIDNNNNIHTKYETNVDGFKFKKLIEQLNVKKLDCNDGVNPNAAQKNFADNQGTSQIFIESENTNGIFKHFQQQKHQNHSQQHQIFQQQQATLMANLQLKAIINRPDAQLLLLRLVKGEISKHGLLIQLANPGLSQTDRDVITAVLTFTSAQQKQLELSKTFLENQMQNIQNLAVFQTLASQQQPLNKQNFPRNSGHLPNISQEDLQAHANIILHNALIKRRLEEQTNFQKMVQLNFAATAVKQNFQQYQSFGSNAMLRQAASTQFIISAHTNNDNKMSVELSTPLKNVQKHSKIYIEDQQNFNQNHIQQRNKNSFCANFVSSNVNKFENIHTTLNQKHSDGGTVCGFEILGTMRIRRPKGISVSQLMVVTAVGVIAGVYIWKPIIEHYTTDKKLEKENSTAVEDLLKKQTANSTPGIMIIGVAATIIVFASYRLAIKPELKSRRRNEAEGLADFIYERELLRHIDEK